MSRFLPPDRDNADASAGENAPEPRRTAVVPRKIVCEIGVAESDNKYVSQNGTPLVRMTLA